MSFILEALKKLETDRNNSDIPNITTIVNNTSNSHQRFSKTFLKPLIGLTVIAVIAGFFLLRQTSQVSVTEKPLPIQLKPVITNTPPTQHTDTTNMLNGNLVTNKVTTDKITAISHNGLQNRDTDDTIQAASKAVSIVEKKKPIPQPTTNNPILLKTTNKVAIKTITEPIVKEKNTTERIFARVVGIKSGCLLEVKRDGLIKLARLANVACMNNKSNVGRKARRYVAEKVFVRNIKIEIISSEPSGTLIADMYAPNGMLLNRSLILAGLATDVDNRFQAAEKEARKNKRGMWANLQKWLDVSKTNSISNDN
jgi:endonuclease YncB( thermonuclease family)